LSASGPMALTATRIAKGGRGGAVAMSSGMPASGLVAAEVIA